MLLLKPVARISSRRLTPQHLTANWLPRPLTRLHCRPSLQTRCYAQPSTQATKAARLADERLKRPSENQKGLPVAERLLIFHAGTGRITFLAMVKVTTLFVGVFFCFILVPAYIKNEKPAWETAGPNSSPVAFAGLIPALFVTYTTAPFVTHVHIHLPTYARTSPAHLERFVRALPDSTPLTVTTMSVIGKPRYSSLQVGDLTPARKRFGLVNFVRDAAVAQENARRRWYMFPAVRRFYVQEKAAPQGRKRYAKKSAAKIDSWIWDVIRQKLVMSGNPVGPKV
ncbi:hypothetical protein S40288_06488 [Stachybotrys chartarum IBT 40288]|nr:hypothetical protein S40288_06488 [Stachybotrys chartarum IBT 40288]